MALEDRLGDMGARAAQEDGVAIRAGAGDGGSTERTASSPLVFNDHGAKHRLHPFRPGAPDGVVPAARREGNHEPDRTVGIFGLSDGGLHRVTSAAAAPRASKSRRRIVRPSSSVPIPKFASLCRSLVCELRNRRTLATY